MRIDQSVINEIKDKTDILDLVSEYVKLEKEDAIISACVLFMMKRHLRSQYLKISKFVTVLVVKGGNVFQFTQEIKDIPFVEAVKELGERVNIKVDVGQTQYNQQSQMASDDLKMIEMHELIQDYYHYALMKTVEGEEALNYLRQRGFTDELIKQRQIDMRQIALILS